jgi:hypothetical protein
MEEGLNGGRQTEFNDGVPITRIPLDLVSQNPALGKVLAIELRQYRISIFYLATIKEEIPD